MQVKADVLSRKQKIPSSNTTDSQNTKFIWTYCPSPNAYIGDTTQLSSLDVAGFCKSNPFLFTFPTPQSPPNLLLSTVSTDGKDVTDCKCTGQLFLVRQALENPIDSETQRAASMENIFSASVDCTKLT